MRSVSRYRAVGGSNIVGIEGRGSLDLAAGVGDESVSLAWLGDALEHAYAHGQMRSLAYLEAVMEDAVFMKEMAERKTALKKAQSVG